jgi:hypothetical protein
MSSTRVASEDARPGICDGKKGIPARCWRPGDSLAGGTGTVRRVSKGRWDAREQTEMITITWDNGAKSYLANHLRRHLKRCVHTPPAQQPASIP